MGDSRRRVCACCSIGRGGGKFGGGPERETDVRDGKLSLRARVSSHSHQRARCEKCICTRIWPRVCVCNYVLQCTRDARVAFEWARPCELKSHFRRRPPSARAALPSSRLVCACVCVCVYAQDRDTHTFLPFLRARKNKS